MSLALLPMAASAASWRGDFETGDLSQWSSTHRMAEDRLRVVQAPVRQGRHALRAEVRRGDDPIGASGYRSELVHLGGEQEGSESVYRWSTLFPSEFPRSERWQVFAQWHHSGNEGSPPMEFYVLRDELQLRAGGERGRVLWKAPLHRERWNDFALRVKWSADPKQGLVELYHGGRQVLPPTAVATLYPGQGVYFKLGLYRDRRIPQPGVLFHDDIARAERLEQVLPPGRVVASAPPLPPVVTPGPAAPPAVRRSPGPEARRVPKAPRRRTPAPRPTSDARKAARELLQKVLERELERGTRTPG